MKRCISALLAGLLIIGIFFFVGCSADQVAQTAEEIRHVAGGMPTTQPHDPLLDAARGAVNAAAAVSPTVATISTIVSLVAGAVVGLARGKRTERKNAHTVIAEIVSDIRAYNEEHVPWTDTTRKLLVDLGYAEEAEPIVNS